MYRCVAFQLAWVWNFSRTWVTPTFLPLLRWLSQSFPLTLLRSVLSASLFTWVYRLVHQFNGMRRQLHVSWQCSVVRRLLQTWHQTSDCACSVSDVLIKKWPTIVTVYQDAHLSDIGCLRLAICIRDIDTTRCWCQDTRDLPHEVSTADSPHPLAGSRSQWRGRCAYRPAPSDG